MPNNEEMKDRLDWIYDKLTWSKDKLSYIKDRLCPWMKDSGKKFICLLD
jgi:hypothetical protein